MKNTGTIIFTTRTVTYAERAKRLLAEEAIPVRIVRLDPAFSPNGCSYGIEFDTAYRDNANRILTANHLPFTDTSKWENG